MKKIIFISLLLLAYVKFCTAGEITIKGIFNVNGIDSIRIVVHSSHLFIRSTFSSKWIKLKNRQFEDRIQTDHDVEFISIDDNHLNRWASHMPTLPNDSIFLIISPVRLSFSGKGFEKWHFMNDVHRGILNRYPFSDNSTHCLQKGQVNWKGLNEFLDSCVAKKKGVIAPEILQMMKADIFGFYAEQRVSLLIRKIKEFNYQIPDWLQREMNQLDAISRSYMLPNLNKASAMSYMFSVFAYLRSIVSMEIKTKGNYTSAALFHEISNHYNGAVEEYAKAILITKRQKEEGIRELIPDLITTMEMDMLRNELHKLYTNLQTGTPLKFAQFINTEQKQVSLTQFKDTVLLIDLWYTGCMSCAEMAPEIRKIAEELKDRPFKVISLSIDRERKKWLNSLKEGLYSSPHHVNLFTGEQGNEHAFIKHYMITGYPTLLLVNKKGILVNNTLSNPRAGEKARAKLIDQIEQYLN